MVTPPVDELARVDAELNLLERQSGLQSGAITVVALLETARGILDPHPARRA